MQGSVGPDFLKLTPCDGSVVSEFYRFKLGVTLSVDDLVHPGLLAHTFQYLAPGEMSCARRLIATDAMQSDL